MQDARHVVFGKDRWAGKEPTSIVAGGGVGWDTEGSWSRSVPQPHSCIQMPHQSSSENHKGWKSEEASGPTAGEVCVLAVTP